MVQDPISASMVMAAALFAGMIGSMMSGGSVLILSILAFLGASARALVGTLKILICVLTLTSFLTYAGRGRIRMDLAIRMALPSAVGSILSSFFVITAPLEVLNPLIAVLVLFGAFLSLLPIPSRARERRGVLPLLAGFGVGAYIGLLGVASTLVTMAVLIRLFGSDVLEANGTAKLVIFSGNLLASIVYSLHGDVSWGLLFLLLPVILGSWLGAEMAIRIGEKGLKAVYLAVSILTVIKLLWA